MSLGFLRKALFGAVVICTLIILTFSDQALGQGGVGSTRGLPDSAGGIHSIQGRVYMPSGRRAGLGIVVRLDGNVNGTRQATTDDDGNFTFNGLPAAEYQLTIAAGSDYDGIKQSVVIYGNTGNAGIGRSGQTLQYDIHLLPKGAGFDEAKAFAGVPQQAVDDYKAAAKAAQSGNHKKAVEQLNAALAVHPNFALALSDLGVQYLKLGDMTKLADTMETLLKLTPNDPHAHLNMGIALYNQKKFPDADSHLRKAVELNPTDAPAHYYLGMTLVSTRQYPEAEKELELAIKNGGQNIALAHKFLGGLYMSSKKNEEAAAELEKYLKLEPKAPDAERIKATVEELRKKH